MADSAALPGRLPSAERISHNLKAPRRAADPAPSRRLPPAHPRDVWSWTAPKYRLRAILLLFLNILLFAGLGLFALWLRTGHLFTASYVGYWDHLARTFSPTRDTGITPVSLLEAPINVVQVPMHAIVLGLLLAALVAIPILVAILYRFPASLPFVGIVAFLAMMPWLAICVTASCILASVKPFRFESRYASALMGLAPVILYLIFASLRTSPAVEAMPNPADHIKYLAPWVFAIISACILLAVGLSLSQLVNYRPGAVAPLLAAMFATPVLLFEYHVGRDELYYRLLEANWTEIFVDHDVSAAIESVWPTATTANGLTMRDRRDVDLLWKLALEGEAPLGWSALVPLQRNLVFGVDRFVRFYPDSRYAVNALYIKAVTLDTRIKADVLLREKKIVHYVDFPADESRHAWEMVLANRPDSSIAAVALLRLAQLDARAGSMQRALDRLDALIQRFGIREAVTQPAARSGSDALFATKPSESTLGIELEHVVLEAVQFRDLLWRNRDVRYGDSPFTGRDATGDHGIGLLRLDPGDLHHADNLGRLLKRYPTMELSDNVELALALLESDVAKRIALLEACLDRHEDGDAFPEILYRHAELLDKSGQTVAAREEYERLTVEHAGTVWAADARERLRHLASVGTPSPPT